MSDQKTTVVEETPSYILLSTGDVITLGSPLWRQYSGQPPRAPERPAGPPRLARADFDALPEDQKWAHIKAGGTLFDPGEPKKPAPPPFTGVTFSRAAFDKLPAEEQSAIARDCIAGDARLVD